MRKKAPGTPAHLPRTERRTSSSKTIIIPPCRTRYLAEIADTLRAYHRRTEEQAEVVRGVWHLRESARATGGTGRLRCRGRGAIESTKPREAGKTDMKARRTYLLYQWDVMREDYRKDELAYLVRDQEIQTRSYYESLSRKKIPKIALPRFATPAKYIGGCARKTYRAGFPFTAGVFPLKRMNEYPTRMFAGEGNPEADQRAVQAPFGEFRGQAPQHGL